VIEWLWDLLKELGAYIAANFDPIRDTIDIAIVSLGIYWLLLLIRGTRAVQILVGLFVLIAALVASNVFELVTMRLILDNFFGSAVLILIVLFQNDIRRALAGSGLWWCWSARRASRTRSRRAPGWTRRSRRTCWWRSSTRSHRSTMEPW
jgi:DNA integrity scanning protein DisA with diadenylate cyclase activity